MILRRLTRGQGILNAASKRIKTFPSPATQTRTLYSVPDLRFSQIFEEKGVGGFLSPQGYKFSWLQYQDTLLQNLNRLTVDTPDASLSPAELVIQSSRWAEKAATFNYASMAYNNQFFFDALHPNAPRPEEGKSKEDLLPKDLHADIANSFSSFQNLREEMLKTANAMFGPGFVWVVKEEEGGLMKVLSTYLAGSPLPEAHARRQPIDMNTYTTNVVSGQYLTVGEHNRRMSQVQNSAGTFGPHSRGAQTAPVRAPGLTKTLRPVLCVKVWEHGWLYDYGLGPRSKALYLERWWEAIDWEHVHMTAQGIQGPGSLHALHPALSRGRRA